MQQETRQRFTLLRFSRASGLSESTEASEDAPQLADISAEPVGSNFDLLLDDVRRRMFPTELAVSGLPALKLVKQLTDDRPDENRVIYLISDFRDSDWKDPADYRQALKDLSDDGAEIRLVSCVRSEQPNLALTKIAPAAETQAAGVPLFIYVSVKNFGKEVARKVTVKIRSIFYDPDAIAGTALGGWREPSMNLPQFCLMKSRPAKPSRAEFK